MSWTDIRSNSRQIVHDTFALEATYLAPGGLPGSEIPVTVRKHTKNLQQRFGLIDREGFAQTTEDISKLIFSLAQVTPEFKGLVTFLDGTKYVLDMQNPRDDNMFDTWDVIELKATP